MKQHSPSSWLVASVKPGGLSPLKRAPPPKIKTDTSPQQRLRKLRKFFGWGSFLWILGTAVGFLGGTTSVEFGLTSSGLIALTLGLIRY